MQSATGGSTTPAGGTTQTVECGKAMSIKATPSSGYKFSKWSIKNGTGKFGDTTSASTNFYPSSDTTIAPSFAKQESCKVSGTVEEYMRAAGQGQISASLKSDTSHSKAITVTIKTEGGQTFTVTIPANNTTTQSYANSLRGAEDPITSVTAKDSSGLTCTTNITIKNPQNLKH